MRIEGSAKSFSIILADDDEMFCRRVAKIIDGEADRIETCHSGKELLHAIGRDPIDLILLDLQLPDMSGLQLLKMVKSTSPDTEIIMITGHSSIDSAVSAIKSGAGNYLCKPIKKHDLLLAIQAAKEKVLLRRENRWLREILDHHEESWGIIGQSDHVLEVKSTIKKIAPLDCNVLIQGDTGTGKQLVAKAVHNQSKRKDKPLIIFNCGGFAEELIANKLFGHEKGAFTGATSREIGLLEAGHGGTVFLDEIGEMSLAMQAKLLHVIEEKRILRLGSTTPVELDIRIIAATNRNLREMSQGGAFREDLFFRLNVVGINLPSLVERKDDLPLLISHFIGKYNRRFGKNISSVSSNALDVLMSYDYPGNIRELENIVQRALALSDGDIIKACHLPQDIQHFSFESDDNYILQPLSQIEKEHISKVLRFTGGDRRMAATILGLPRTTLWRRMKQYDLQ